MVAVGNAVELCLTQVLRLIGCIVTLQLPSEGTQLVTGAICEADLGFRMPHGKGAMKMGHWINKRDKPNRRKNRVLHNESLEPRQLLAGHGWGAAHAEGSSGTDGMPADRDCPAAQVASQDGEQTRLLGRSSQRGRVDMRLAIGY